MIEDRADFFHHHVRPIQTPFRVPLGLMALVLFSPICAGAIRTVRGDKAIGKTAPDFIKIDVEGMEMDVLHGLEMTVGTHKPTMFVEVFNANEQAFLTWLKKMNYDVIETFRRYKLANNYLVKPMA